MTSKVYATLGAIGSLFALSACNAGDMRMWNDALAATNGYDVYYPNQSNTKYVGDIRWETGVYNGEGYMEIENESRKYCRVRVLMENGDYKYYNMDPWEYEEVYVSIYNQADGMETICNTTSAVFQSSFD